MKAPAWKGTAWRPRGGQPLFRPLTLRRVAAALLLAAGAWMALTDTAPQATAPTVVAAHDLAPGQVLRDSDLRLAHVPSAAVPVGALSTPSAAIGRPLAAGAREGEILTDLRLLSPRLTAAAAGVRDARAVPIRLADPGVAALLQPGDRVDVLTSGGAPDGTSTAQPELLAENAAVLFVTGDASGAGAAHRPGVGTGLIVLLALDKETAASVATSALDRPVTVTLH